MSQHVSVDDKSPAGARGGLTASEAARSAFVAWRERQDEMLGQVDVGLWYCDLPFSELIWDRKVKEHFWLPPDAHVTIDTFYERIQPEDRERTRQAIERSIEAHAPYDIEYRTVAPHDSSEAGSVKWIRAIGYTGYDAAGAPIRFDGITVDITGAKTAAVALADAETALREAANEEARVVSTLQRIGSTLAAELELDAIVQTVTDEATRLTGAQFGAFFYNVLNEKGESYTLYSLSGVPREAFSRFPMPRNTAVFAPTFHGEGVVRSDDITKDPRYGHSAPHYGMPKGHLPVVSYLAVPVKSHSGDVIGGLFFGHERPAVFTERHEQLVNGIAGWAALAMDNAGLFAAQRAAAADAERSRSGLQTIFERTRLLAEATAVFSESLDPQAVLEGVVRVSVPFVADYCLAYRVNGNGESIGVASTHADDTLQPFVDLIARSYEPSRDNPTGPLSAVLRTRKTVVVNALDIGSLDRAATSPEVREAFHRVDPGSGVFLPLVARGRLVGTLAFVRSAHRPSFDASDVELAEQLAHRAAVSLDNARLFAEAEDARARTARMQQAAEHARVEAETARRDAEEANQAKSQFLARMSHDLRTPLNAIGGFTQLLDMGVHGPINDDQRFALGRVTRAQEHLLTLINDILSFARLEAGQVHLQLEPLPAKPFVEELAALVGGDAKARGLKLRCDTGPDALTVLADRERLIQILLNLASNAIKFTDRGWVEVGVREREGRVEFRVADSGRGIPANRIVAIFDPFVQARNAADEEKGGVGLGLAISRDLARLMNGELKVESEEGRGSTFTLQMPRG